MIRPKLAGAFWDFVAAPTAAVARTVASTPVPSASVLDGGDPGGNYAATSDGGSPTTTYTTIYDGGAP